MRTLADFPLGSTWVRDNERSRGYDPILVVDHWTARPLCPESIDYFVYLCLASGRTHYCLKGSRDFDEQLERLA